jgi:hypothetical protein
VEKGWLKAALNRIKKPGFSSNPGFFYLPFPKKNALING